jgi:hypothetical protein
MAKVTMNFQVSVFYYYNDQLDAYEFGDYNSRLPDNTSLINLTAFFNYMRFKENSNDIQFNIIWQDKLYNCHYYFGKNGFRWVVKRKFTHSELDEWNQKAIAFLSEGAETYIGDLPEKPVSKADQGTATRLANVANGLIHYSPTASSKSAGFNHGTMEFTNIEAKKQE